MWTAKGRLSLRTSAGRHFPRRFSLSSGRRKAAAGAFWRQRRMEPMITRSFLTLCTGRRRSPGRAILRRCWSSLQETIWMWRRISRKFWPQSRTSTAIRPMTGRWSGQPARRRLTLPCLTGWRSAWLFPGTGRQAADRTGIPLPCSAMRRMERMTITGAPFCFPMGPM